jgi:AcrR family transcriptional regulator
VNINSHLQGGAPDSPTARQAEILDRAAELVAESGLANLTMKRLAERVGFTEPAIYRHFPGKRALVRAMIERFSGRLLGTIGALAADRTLGPRERLLAMVRHHVSLLRVSRGLPILLIAEGLASGDGELIAQLGSVMQRYAGLLGGVLAELDLDLGVAPERQATLFFGLPAAIGIQLRAFPDLALTEEETEILVRHYVRSLTTPAAIAAIAPGDRAAGPEARP